MGGGARARTVLPEVWLRHADVHRDAQDEKPSGAVQPLKVVLTAPREMFSGTGRMTLAERLEAMRKKPDAEWLRLTKRAKGRSTRVVYNQATVAATIAAK